MPTGLGTASSVMKGVGGVASMVPVYGQAIGAGLSAIGGIMDMVDAGKQQQEAERLQKEAEKVKKGLPEKEYLQALRGYKMMQLGGMPSLDVQKTNIDLGAANALKSIKEASPYGGSVVDAINAVLNKGSQQKQMLGAEDAQFKAEARLRTLGMLEKMGGLQRELTKEQRARQEALYSQAGDMLAASTANKQIGREKALGAGIQGIGALAKGLGGGGTGSGDTLDADMAGFDLSKLTPEQQQSLYDLLSKMNPSEFAG